MQLSDALPKLPRQQGHSGELAVQPNKHSGLVAGAKSYWISDGAREEGDEFLWNQVCGGLVRASGACGGIRRELAPPGIRSLQRAGTAVGGQPHVRKASVNAEANRTRPQVWDCRRR